MHQQVSPTQNPNEPGAIPIEVIQAEGRDWWLWGFGFFVSLALILGILSYTLPWPNRTLNASYWMVIREWVRALAACTLIFHLYAVYQHLHVKRIRRRVAERDRIFQLICENTADMIAVVSGDGQRLYNSPAYEKILGYSAAELKATSSIEQIHPDDLPRVLSAAEKARLSGQGDQVEYRMRHKDGSWRTLESTACAIRNARGQTDKLVIVNRDITERKHAEELLVHNAALRHAEEKYRSIFEDAVVGIFQITPEGRPLKINRALAQIHGYDSPQQLMSEVENLVSKLFVDPHQFEDLKRVLEENGTVGGAEIEVRCRGKRNKWVLVNMRAVRSQDEKIVLYEGTLEDISARKAAENRVQFLAYHDALTGLPNLSLLHDRLRQALARARREKSSLALLYVDLDGFKLINDTLGHSFGDLLLQEVAQRLKQWVREQDTVARIGGDEFLILLTSAKEASDVAAAAERMAHTISNDLVIQGRALTLSCSIGICIFPEHGSDVDTLIKNADAAMYSAKENGRNGFRFFTDDMNAQVTERLTLENSLRAALGKNELFLVYQPQMEIATGRITGFEALIRWQHAELGFVPPEKFIRVAENCGLIKPIGEWVLRTACQQARKWQDEGLCALPIAVNVSAVQFRQPGFQELIRRVLEETGLDPRYLELEVTEGLLLSHADMTSNVLRDLKVMGVKLAIDDFGTGYSSLSYLKRFPFSKLKIDRSFIRDVAVNSDDEAIAIAIISMAKSLGLKAIAEGVENDAQVSFLRKYGCDELQGYYFSRPLKGDDVPKMLREMPREKISLVARGHASTL